MSKELKPVNCGCGGEALLHIIGKPVSYERDWFVQCDNCGTRTDEYDDEAEAVTAWNRAMGADVNSVVSVFSSEVKDE